MAIEGDREQPIDGNRGRSRATNRWQTIAIDLRRNDRSGEEIVIDQEGLIVVDRARSVEIDRDRSMRLIGGDRLWSIVIDRG